MKIKLFVSEIEQKLNSYRQRKNLFPKNLPGHRIIGWKSEDESHVIENLACNSTS